MMVGGAGLDGFRSHGPVGRVRSYRSRNVAVSYLDSLGIKFQAFFLVGEELLNVLTLIALELDHLAHLSIDDDGAIAGC